MKFDTKFDIGQEVFIIRKDFRETHPECSFCAGSGEITGQDNTLRTCPSCYSRGHQRVSEITGFRPDGPMRVGRVSCEMTDSPGIPNPEGYDNYTPKQSKSETYMLVETGVGSGSVWPVDKLYETWVGAKAAADKQNAEARKDTP